MGDFIESMKRAVTLQVSALINGRFQGEKFMSHGTYNYKRTPPIYHPEDALAVFLVLACLLLVDCRNFSHTQYNTKHSG